MLLHSDPTTMGEPLSLSSEKWFQILHALVDPVMVVTPQGELWIGNKAFEDTFPFQEPTSRSVYTLFETIAPQVEPMIRDVVQDKRAISNEISIQTGHYLKHYLLQLTPILQDAFVSEVVAVFHDMTHIKNTEKVRRDFVANVSHELRTPLSAIQGFSETLLDGAYKDHPVAQEFIQIILNHALRLSQLVRDLLDLSKLESEENPIDLEAMPLNRVLHTVLPLQHPVYEEKQVKLHSSIPDDLPLVMGHAHSLEQVLSNLLDNARKYTPIDGKVTLKAFVHPNQRYVQVNIQDTGAGIDQKHISRLFERFYRVDKARSRELGGTGLGLAIVKHIIHLHGGEVWVTSQVGQGSTFSFTLKVASPEQSTAKTLG